jgi:hypothetical protein
MKKKTVATWAGMKGGNEEMLVEGHEVTEM